MKTANPPADAATDSQQPTVSYPLESVIFALLTGARKLDLTETSRMLAIERPVLDKEAVLFVLPEPLQHLFTFIQQEAVKALPLMTEFRMVDEAIDALHAEDVEHDSTKCSELCQSAYEIGLKIKANESAVKSYKRVFWAIVNEMTGEKTNVGISEGFAVVKEGEEESGLGSILGALLSHIGIGGIEIVGMGSSGPGSGDSLDGLFGSLFSGIGRRRH